MLPDSTSSKPINKLSCWSNPKINGAECCRHSRQKNGSVATIRGKIWEFTIRILLRSHAYCNANRVMYQITAPGTTRNLYRHVLDALATGVGRSGAGFLGVAQPICGNQKNTIIKPIERHCIVQQGFTFTLCFAIIIYYWYFSFVLDRNF